MEINLKECIDYHNHFSTMPINSFIIDKDAILQHKPYYEGSVTLNTILNSFGNAYKNFKEDYKELPKFDLGDSYEFLDYNNQDNRWMTLYVENPSFADKDCELEILEKDNDINCYAVFDNDISSVKPIEITENNKLILKKYMDFLDKHASFIECYLFSKQNTTYGRYNALFKFEYLGDLYTKLDNIKFHVLIDYKCNKFYATIVFNLDNKSIDYNSSSVEGIAGNKKEIIDSLVNTIYINRERIAYSYKDESSEDIILRLKKGLDI